MAAVRVALADGQETTAALTLAAVDQLSFAPGDKVLVVIKATEVMLAKEWQ